MLYQQYQQQCNGIDHHHLHDNNNQSALKIMNHLNENTQPAPPVSACLGPAAPLRTWKPLLANSRGRNGHHICNLCRNDHNYEIIMTMALVWYYHYQPIQHRDENNYHYPPKNQVSSVSTVSTTTAGGLGGETREPWRWLQWARKPHAQAQVHIHICI